MNEDLFPELNFTALQSFGRIWAQRFSPSRITLHRASHPYRYALIFHDPSIDGENFLKGLFAVSELLTPDFISVYRDYKDETCGPSWHFRDDWTTELIRTDTEGNLETEILEAHGLDPEHWLLYPRSEEQQEKQEFQRDGLYPALVNGVESGWFLVLAGKSVEGSFTRNGFKYLKALMDNPGRKYGCDELAKATGENLLLRNAPIDYDTGVNLPATSTESPDNANGESWLFEVTEPKQDTLVAQAREINTELQEARKNQDLGRQEQLQRQYDELTNEILAIRCKAETPDTQTVAQKRNYKRISKAIHRAISDVKKADSETGELLNSCVKFRSRRIMFNPPSLPLSE